MGCSTASDPFTLCPTWPVTTLPITHNPWQHFVSKLSFAHPKLQICWCGVLASRDHLREMVQGWHTVSSHTRLLAYMWLKYSLDVPTCLAPLVGIDQTTHHDWNRRFTSLQGHRKTERHPEQRSWTFPTTPGRRVLVFLRHRVVFC